jgi:NAD(P)H-hydrate epimerase
VVDIGIPPAVAASREIKRWWLHEELVSGWITPRIASAHKGLAGHVGVLSGSTGKTGAASLVCEGAGRVGAGLVTLFVPTSLNPILEAKLTEAMTYPIAETAEHTPGERALPEILRFMEGKQAFAMGPGISLHPETQNLVKALLVRMPCPMVIDADALSILTSHLELLQDAPFPVVMTPHPGEMARLMGTSTRTVQENRLETASRFSREHSVILVLKGLKTLIAAPDGRLAVNSTGNPAMASGGMGDALTGMIAGLLAQGFEPFQAACLGVYIHGAAADRRMEKVATRGLLASDLLHEIPRVIGQLEGFKDPSCTN